MIGGYMYQETSITNQDKYFIDNNDSKLSDAYNRHYKFLFDHAKSLTHESHSAQDIVQTVFANLLAKNRRLSEIKSLQAYLARVVKNAAILHLKRKANEKQEPFDSEIIDLIASPLKYDPQNIAAKNELLEKLVEIKRKLTCKQIEIMDCMLSEESVSTRQIGRYVGCSHKNVQAVIGRIRRNFGQIETLL